MRSVALIVTLFTFAIPLAAQETAFDGSLWTRYETRDLDPGTEATFTWLQTRVGAELTFSPLVQVYAQLQDARRLGEETSVNDGSADRLDLHQGYLEVGTFGETPLWVRAGRQEYEIAFGRILGIPIWSPTSRVYDGLRTAFPLGEDIRIEVFGFQIAETTQSPNPSDEYLFGGWGEVPLGDAQTLHLVALHDRDNAVAETSRTTLFAELDGRLGPVRGRAEAGAQLGEVAGQNITSGSLLAIFAAIPWDDERGTVGLGVDRYGGTATPGAGETAGFSDLFGRNHRFLGFADLFNDPRANVGGRGLLALNPRATWQLRPELQLRGDYHHFRLVDSEGLASGKLADEIDLQIWGQVLDGLDIRAGGSWVGAADPLVDLGLSTGDQLFGYIQVSAGFWGGAPGGVPR